MKNTSSLIILIFSFALILSSCGSQSGISLTKRHYRNGYHVELGKGKLPQTAKVEVKSDEVIDIEQSTEAEQLINDKVTPGSASLATEPEKQVILANNETAAINHKQDAAVGESEAKPATGKNKLFSEGTGSIKKVIKNSGIKEMIKSNSNTASASEDGGGLLWTIIAILLVLWLIGLLTGTTLGGLIYILLVVALVLVLIRLLGRL
jgi:hypothetical protein